MHETCQSSAIPAPSSPAALRIGIAIDMARPLHKLEVSKSADLQYASVERALLSDRNKMRTDRILLGCPPSSFGGLGVFF
jgi:hypothetical protein